MRPDDVLRLVQRQPFRRFRLHLSTGIVHEIRHPELAMVGRSTVTLEFPPQNYPLPVAERRVIVALIHIVQMEFAEPTPPPSAN
jgi:hypothetical protein